MDDLEFVDGLIVKAPHENAPSFVKASISIKSAVLAAWLTERLQANGEDWVNLDVKEARSGKWYAAVSTFKPKKTGKPTPQPGSKFADMEDDVPF
jgi:hypothetical protein